MADEKLRSDVAQLRSDLDELINRLWERGPDVYGGAMGQLDKRVNDLYDRLERHEIGHAAPALVEVEPAQSSTPGRRPG